MRRPWLLPTIALVLGVGAALALAIAMPAPPPVAVDLPAWLAERISPLGDRHCVFERPQALWLMPIAAGPFILAIAARSLVDLRPLQILVQLVARLALLLALALALALPTLQSPTRGKTIVVAVDVSESVDDEQLAAATALVREAAGFVAAESGRDLDREDRTRLRLVTYGARARALAIDEGDPEALTIPRDPEHALGSDHAGALRLAAALVDPESEGRLVLVTDGGGSRSERADLIATARELGERGLGVYTRAFPPQARADLVVRGVHLPDELRVGQTFDVVVDVAAIGLAEGERQRLTLRLDKDGAPNPLTPFVEIEVPGPGPGGDVQVKIPARVTQPGPVVFTATLDAGGVPA
ncbi:MAG: hypothetical protein R3B09_31655, partial [Nannocystaceae bacterium]